MHIFKFDQFIKKLNGYNVEEMKLKKIGKIPFSFQTFNYKEEGVEVIYDLRIVQLKDDFYSFYSLGKSAKKNEILKVTDGIIESLSEENIEINQ